MFDITTVQNFMFLFIKRVSYAHYRQRVPWIWKPEVYFISTCIYKLRSFFFKKNPHVIYFFLCWSFPISFNYCNLILLSCSKSSIYYYTVHCYKIYIQTPDFISYCIVSNDGKMYIFPFSLTFQRRMNVWHCILCFLTNGWRAICKNQIF